MASGEQDEFAFDTEQSSGATDYTLVQCSTRKVKTNLVITKGDQDHACEVVHYSTSKPGKHGAAKASITGIDIFTGKKYEGSFGTKDTLQQPEIIKEEMLVTEIDPDEGYISCMSENTYTISSYKLGEKIKDSMADLQQKFAEVYKPDSGQDMMAQVVKWRDNECILSYRTRPITN